MNTSYGASATNSCNGSAVSKIPELLHVRSTGRAALVPELTQTEGPMLARPAARAEIAPKKGWPASRAALPGLMFLFAFVLRMLYLNHESVSGDEAFSMSVSQLPLKQMLAALVQDFVHPPLHYFVLRGWFKLFGFGLFQARLLSVIFGTLAVVSLYLLAEYLFDRRTALLSAVLMSVSQLAIMYSQEVRPYAQFHFLALISSYLFLRAMREGRSGYWWSFVASAILMLYTDYFSVYLIVALLVVAAIYRKNSRLRLWWVLTGGVLTVALYLPWITSGILHAATNSEKTFMGTSPWGAVRWQTFFSALNFFNNGKPTGLRADSPWWTYIVGGLLFSAPLLWLLWKAITGREVDEQPDRKAIAITGILWLLPLLLTLGAGRALHVPYNVRYVSFSAAFYYLLVARAILELPISALRWGLVALILIYSVNSLRANYLMRWKEYWDDAFAYVQQNRQAGDCGVFLPDFEIPPQWPVTQAGRPSFRVLPKDGVAAELPGCSRVWEVSWAPRDDFRWLLKHEAKNTVLQATYQKIDEQHYFGVRVALYSRKEQ